MTELSLNWKRLSTAILLNTTRKRKEASKERNKNKSIASARIHTNKKVSKDNINGNELSHSKLLSKKTSPKIIQKKVTDILQKAASEKPANSHSLELAAKPTSLIARALWDFDRGITVEDIHNVVLSKQPSALTPRKKDIGKYVALDCEFVGVGPEGTESALARVSFVNFYGHVIYDRFVRPREKVTDWRTWVSGVTAQHMTDAISFDEAQKEALKILETRILIGHAVHHDLDSLFLSHPRFQIRDTSKFGPFRAISNGRTPSLKKLIKHFLKMDIQDGSHSSVEDAQATMLLYRLHRDTFEKSIRSTTAK